MPKKQKTEKLQLKKSTLNHKAFTLVELLVTISIIGLLTSIVLVVVKDKTPKADIAKTMQWSRSIESLLGAYAVGIWNFDEGTGTTATDLSGYGNDGTLVNDPTWRCAEDDSSYTPSGHGCALEFDGSTNYIGNIAQTAVLDPSSITVSSWINMNINAPTERNIWLTKWYGYSCEIQADTRKPYFRLRGPGDTFSSKSLTLGLWHNFVGTYDPLTGGNVYLDGEVVGSKGPSGDIIHTWQWPLNIGRFFGGVYFAGLIDDVRIYETALTSAQVEAIYYVGLDNLYNKGKIGRREYLDRLVQY